MNTHWQSRLGAIASGAKMDGVALNWKDIEQTLLHLKDEFGRLGRATLLERTEDAIELTVAAERGLEFKLVVTKSPYPELSLF